MPCDPVALSDEVAEAVERLFDVKLEYILIRGAMDTKENVEQKKRLLRSIEQARVDVRNAMLRLSLIT